MSASDSTNRPSKGKSKKTASKAPSPPRAKPVPLLRTGEVYHFSDLPDLAECGEGTAIKWRKHGLRVIKCGMERPVFITDDLIAFWQQHPELLEQMEATE